jgi:hypothetical protein
MEQLPGSDLTRMTAIRDLASSVCHRLTPHLGASLAYSRAFIHAGDGFGYYARFRRAEEWDDLLPRLGQFFDALRARQSDWVEYIEWCSAPKTLQDLDAAKNCMGDHQSCLALYDQLLRLMLTTPASWGDRVYWIIHQRADERYAPFLAKWKKEESGKPWHLSTFRHSPDGLSQFGEGEVTEGEVPPDAPSGASSLFWEFLYPLCNRPQFSPPQDPTKHSQGDISQLILPIHSHGKAMPIAWILGQAESAKCGELILESLSRGSCADTWCRIHDEFRSLLTQQ